MCHSGLPTSTSREVLPANVKPIHYDLTLEPDLKTFKFFGEETIDFEVKEKSDFISLNLFDITIDQVKIDGKDVKETVHDDVTQTVTFKFHDQLVEGKNVKLYLKFTGELNNKMAGFYRSSYEENGETKYMATTQMEPTDCRRAFPCYDEPAAKAKFSISLIVDKPLVALSNMDEKETQSIENNKKKVIFNTTPLMSTYLVAFIVGDLKYVENNDFRVPIKVYATPGYEHLGQYSADIAAKTLKFFESKFDLPYPLPKCDFAAIHDFSAGAMENFGLITYRTIDVLIDIKTANTDTQKRVTEVVMHELAHQWFGNLVTMDFWDGLWLNEGFATWMSWYSCNELYPEWNIWESYVSDTLQGALGLDALRSSHPIEVPVNKVSEINQIFDAISYNKGSAVLKMVSKWLGEETFVKGVSKYLHKHKWGNTKTTDLWQSLSEVSGKDVVSVMDIWTKNIGYPLIKVEESKDGLKVSQQRFLVTNDVKPDEDKILYPVFLALKTSEGVDESLILDGKSKEIKANFKDDFFKINGDQSGIYRTLYEPSRWNKLGEAAVAGKLSVEDRVGLVADANSLSFAGLIKTTDLLNLIKSWNAEKSYIVWDRILSSIASIKANLVFEEDSVIDSLNNFTLRLIDSQLKTTGWEIKDDDSYGVKQLKSSLFSAAVGARHKEAKAYAEKSFSEYVGGNKDAIKSDLRKAIFSSVAKDGDEKVFDQVFNIYKNPTSLEEKRDALLTFGIFRQPEIMDKVVSFVLNEEIVKPQDIYYPLGGLSTHKGGILREWAWLQENWEAINKAFPASLNILTNIVKISVSKFTSESQKKNVEKFFADKETKGFDKGLAQSLDVVSAKIAWVNRDASEVIQWLHNE